ncbi:HK97-gp10 family putative phage morphogenesis protein [Afipia sp. TerB]
MALRAKVKRESRDAVMKRLRDLVPQAEAAAAKAQAEAAQDLADAIKPRVRRRSGKLADSIESAKLSDRPGQKPVGIQQTKDPNAYGIFAVWYWRFVEFGTRRSRAFPAIFPTYRQYRKRIRRKIAAAINKEIKRAKG